MINYDPLDETSCPEDDRILQLMTPRELGEPTSLWDALEERGWTPKHPSQIIPGEVESRFKRLVLDLAWIHVYIVRTDHLSDVELYERLYERIEDYPFAIWPEDPESAITLTFAFTPDADDESVWLRYYAEDFDRRKWAELYPEVLIPEAELPRHCRDWLPIRSE